MSRERAAAVGLVLAAALSPQLGAAFAVTLFDELGPAGAAFLGGSGLALAMAIGALIVLPAGVIQAERALAEPDLLGSALIVALASSVLPYSLELEALRRLPEAVFGVLMSLDPAVAALAGFVVLDQVLGARELLAIAMVVVASAGAASLSHVDDRGGNPARAAGALRARDRPRAFD